MLMPNLILELLLIAAALSAQTPPGFVPKVDTILPVAFEHPYVPISPPGVLIPKKDTAAAPVLTAPASLSSSSPSGLYIVIMLDRNVTYKSQQTTFLHWFQPNLLPTTSPAPTSILSPNLTTTHSSASALGAPFYQPTPPRGSGPHQYILLLFAQPIGFVVPKDFSSINPPPSGAEDGLLTRVGFNVTKFAGEAGLGEPVAANWFQVLNGTAAETSSVMATATGGGGMGTATGSSPVASDTSTGMNGAVGIGRGGGIVEVGLGLGVVMGGWML